MCKQHNHAMLDFSECGPMLGHTSLNGDLRVLMEHSLTTFNLSQKATEVFLGQSHILFVGIQNSNELFSTEISKRAKELC